MFHSESMRIGGRRFLALVATLLGALSPSGCQRTPSIERALTELAQEGAAADPATARAAIRLASEHELAIVRRGAVDAIVHVEATQFWAELRRALEDKQPGIRLQAARAFGRWATAADADVLQRAAAIEEDGSTPEAAADMAAQAVTRVRLVQNPEPARQAIKALDDPAAHARIFAAVTLGYYAWPPSIPALQQVLQRDADPLAQAMAACALASFDAAAVAPVITELLTLSRGDHPVGRRCAVKALGASGDPRHAGVVAQALKEKDSLTRRWAAGALRRLDGATRHREILALAVRKDPDLAVRAEALRTLGAANGAGDDAILRDALHDGAPRVRAVAAHELIRAGAADALGPALADPSWEVRIAALIGLTERQPPAAAAD